MVALIHEECGHGQIDVSVSRTPSRREDRVLKVVAQLVQELPAIGNAVNPAGSDGITT